MYDTALINIVMYAESIHVYIEQVNNKKIKNATEKIFVLNDSYNDELLYDYIKPFTEDTPYYYIAMLDSSLEQGAIPTCDKHKMPIYAELATAKYLCIDNQWACYTSKLFLEEEMKLLGDIGCDFIYSPFVILRNFYADKIEGDIALYVFVQEQSLTVAVFKNDRLLFGEYIDTRLEITPEEEMQLSAETLETPKEETDEPQEESVDLDEIELGNDDLSLDDDLDDIDSFDNIEELGDIDSIEAEENPEQQLEENLEAISEETQEFSDETKQIERTSEDFKRFSLIQKSLAKFYNDERFESDFIENLFVADAVHLTNDFKRYIQEEMFLSVYIRSIEPELEVCQLAKEELGLV